METLYSNLEALKPKTRIPCTSSTTPKCRSFNPNPNPKPKLHPKSFAEILQNPVDPLINPYISQSFKEPPNSELRTRRPKF